MKEGVRLVQLNLPPPRIIEVNLVQGFKLIFFGFIGSIISLSRGVATGTANTEPITSFASCMQQPPGIRWAPIGEY